MPSGSSVSWLWDKAERKLRKAERKCAVVCTSNCAVNDLESRFQSRFQVIQLKSPTDEEITAFLSGRWELKTSIARQIATLACGNVRQALLDAQSYLTA